MRYNYISLSVTLYLMQGENRSRTSQELHSAFEFELKMNWIFSYSSAPWWYTDDKSVFPRETDALPRILVLGSLQ